MEEEKEGVERLAWLKQGSARRSIKLREWSKTAPSELVAAQLRNAQEEMGY